jgi:hypothetical protein
MATTNGTTTGMPYQTITTTTPYPGTSTVMVSPGSCIAAGTVTYPYPYPSSSAGSQSSYDSLECEKIKCKEIIIDNQKLSKLLEPINYITLPENLDVKNVTVADAVGEWYIALQNLKQKYKQLLTIQALCEKQK